MKDIAVVICNYNKKEYVIKCVASLKSQNIDNFDIYVVDNASNDGSADEIQKTYGDEVTLICNDKNLGGSGGFNTGMRVAYDAGYKYIVLLDNDVVVREDCIESFYNDMEEYSDIGIMGAKILKMDKPDVIQEFGSFVDFNEMRFKLAYENEKDPEELPHINECDYVPACALVVRKELIEKVGFMPEENFIYYDDILWGMRCKRAGYKVAADSRAVAWHKGGGGANPTTFPNYYLIRNKTRFFALNRDASSLPNGSEGDEILAKNILREVYEGIYACAYNDLSNIAKTRFDAFLDALNGVSGRAVDGRIRQKEKSRERLYKLLSGKKTILVYVNGDYDDTKRIISEIRYHESLEGTSYQIDLAGEGEASILGIAVKNTVDIKDDEYDLVINACKHVFYVAPEHMDKIWVDGWTNVITNEKDAELCRGFASSYKVFELCFMDRLVDFIVRMNTEEIKKYGRFV
ncbi:glycosyltransferase [Butyrivibrio sp. FCS006]|uniref:glycosyltransferase n=1 Tax=Butyrivibrio sp. FCS006 TaxID=1280684 RepID=UPI000413C0E9|nr:glycosyltransferase [Butyrivibrio sp. FCS006]